MEELIAEEPAAEEAEPEEGDREPEPEWRADAEAALNAEE
jgi:hypothetical protein